MTNNRPLTQQLKEDNWDMHQIAEHGEGTGSVLRGEWNREQYAEMIAQGYLVHKALDLAVSASAEARPDLAALFAHEHLLAEHFAKDLAYFEIDTTSIVPSVGTTRFITHIASAASDPLAVLGLHYVRTGASNGNRFVAKKARQIFNLPDTGEGTAHLDPYGEAQRQHWAAFKAELDRVELTNDEKQAVVASARNMYELFINWNAPEHLTATELLERHKAQLDKAEFDRAHAAPAGH
jgi:heme oxygenase